MSPFFFLVGTLFLLAFGFALYCIEEFVENGSGDLQEAVRSNRRRL